MTLARTAAEVLEKHVEFELESIDRLYLNLYVPLLQQLGGVARFWTHHRGHDFATSTLMASMTRAFVQSIEAFARLEGVDLIRFQKGKSKESVAREYLKTREIREGVLFIGKAQERVRVVRSVRRRNPRTGKTYPWLADSTAMVNHYYFYCVDRDFGLFFIKFCSYFPYGGKACLNGHEYLKRQLAQRGIAFEALDNGLMACAAPGRAQRLANGLGAVKIERLLRKWLSRLPHPFSPQDRRAGYRYDISIRQAEMSLTQVLDRPQTGRIFFEQLFRDNLDLGRPDRIQLVFGRRITRRTPGTFRTRICQKGVTPNLEVHYKNTRIKQYHKLSRAVRTETVINDSYDFAIGRRLKNLDPLREVGLQANRRLLSVQRISHDATIGEEALQRLGSPRLVGSQRAAALRFTDRRVLALFAALLVFRLLPRGFSNRDLRPLVAEHQGIPPEDLSPGQMTYDLRRLRLHGLIERIPKTQRYRVTERGCKTALFLTRAYNRLLRPALSITLDPHDTPRSPVRTALLRFDRAIDDAWNRQQLAA